MKYLMLSVALVSVLGCKQQAKVVLIAGDSWSFFVCVNKSLDQAFQTAGIQDASANAACEVTSRVGLRAENWLESPAHKATVATLEADRSVRAIYLSIGGNDVINHWKKSMSPVDEQALFKKVKADVRDIIQRYRRVRPDVKILLSGYDFPRFVPNHPIGAYRDAFRDMEEPAPETLNAAVLRLSDTLSELQDDQNVFYIQHYGLMHYYYGNKENGLASGVTLPPASISPRDNPSASGGDSRLLGPAEGMLRVGGLVDAFHLNNFGYDRIADHAVSMHLRTWFK